MITTSSPEVTNIFLLAESRLGSEWKSSSWVHGLVQYGTSRAQTTRNRHIYRWNVVRFKWIQNFLQPSWVWKIFRNPNFKKLNFPNKILGQIDQLEDEIWNSNSYQRWRFSRLEWSLMHTDHPKSHYQMRWSIRVMNMKFQFSHFILPIFLHLELKFPIKSDYWNHESRLRFRKS